jgi:hypothetical protein
LYAIRIKAKQHSCALNIHSCCITTYHPNNKHKAVKQILHYIFGAVLLLPSISVFAQYKGGSGDGNTFGVVAAISLGRNIFKGGNDDGNNVSTILAQPLGSNIFKGGIDDGTIVGISANQSLGRNIFKGGIDDGTIVAVSANQSLGRNIFKGGIDDGTAVATVLSQPLGRNIFTGGANDGWAMALKNNLALPVTLSDFSGQWQQNNALLLWQTASELNSAYFELQRSFDGSTFTPVGTVAAAGESNTPRNYQYTDANVKSLMQTGSLREVFYRLRSVDKDAKETYSGIVILRADPAANTYSIFPNPARDVVTITSTEAIVTGNTYIYMADVNGRLLLQKQMTNRQQQLNLSALPSGTYFLQLVNTGKIVYTQKIIIQK